ncbi:hypothetical protein Athai_03850 [Actinocatenispora thailandica]|uniref:FHA domain-containing protein n=1 Tax=Actinocatenispora thailandica TaxID=227318 RepID=A0A7R7DK32_9ACTN|nr:FHA domain-containing protein [Actinocatenispora thailandica]BCJ32882.1 hypothetical protein Athai_03850 [Actinocatenispora thailandica]
MRFEVTRVLDSIERRLCTDPGAARAIVDLAPIVRQVELDGGRPAHLLRLGLVIDALGTHLGEPGAKVYVVVDRALITDLELTSNEKMVLRRWADDGLVEALPEVDDRLLELSAYTGLPVVSRDDFARFAGRHPWAAGAPFLIPVPGVGGAALMTRPGAAPTMPRPTLDPATQAVLGRYWRCPEPGCVLYGTPGPAQPPPRVRSGRAVCPRHGVPMHDGGPRQQATSVTIWIRGEDRGRFPVASGAPVVVGRSPEGPGGIRLGELLDDEAVHWVSRSHVRLELLDGALVVTDTSTNGTTVHTRSGPDAVPETITLHRGQQRRLGDWDVVELHEGVQLCRADRRPDASGADDAPVMAEAPTMAIRLPGSAADRRG